MIESIQELKISIFSRRFTRIISCLSLQILPASGLIYGNIFRKTEVLQSRIFHIFDQGFY